ncbi:MAG: 4-hydroxythreonine-4-phosphate dehydrogenase PdxA [Mariprofundaceae bacterium]|nr:4-hydroxythreonine-4-phosphate dehydrogenase PdxA [Mariprofundaceae bacterium]
MTLIPSSPLLLTLGEPAGIGPDCVLLAFSAHPELFNNVTIAAPSHWLSNRAKELGINIDIVESRSPKRAGAESSLFCWNPLPDGVSPGSVTTGKTSASTAAAVIACIESAAHACLQKEASALITAPIEKAVLRNSGFDFPGHTEFLAGLAGVERVVMMLASSQLRVALLTTHMPLKDVSGALNIADVAVTLRITHHDLKQRFGLASPRLALCGLNPHAGEQQHFGDEEETILSPAIHQVKQQGIDIEGPLPADTLFSPQMRKKYDAIICCYHDQGLIPIKALSFGDAVNITLGLPFIRTSVDHGTALERAGTGKVSYSSIMEAIRMARLMLSNTALAEVDDAD